MTLFSKDGTFLNRSANAKQVYDVSGAGDTVVAAIAVFLACGMDWREILVYANIPVLIILLVELVGKGSSP